MSLNHQVCLFQLLAYQKNPGIHYSFTVPLDMVDKVMADMLSVSRTGTPNRRRNHSGFQQNQQHSRRHHHGNQRNGRRRHQEGQTAEAVRTPRIQQLSAPEKIDSRPQSELSPSIKSQALRLAGSSTYQHQSGHHSSHSTYGSRSHNRYLPESTGVRNHQSGGMRPAFGNTRRLSGSQRHSLFSDRHSVFGSRHSTLAHIRSGGSTHGTSSWLHPGSGVRTLQYGQQPRYVPPYKTQQQEIARRYDNRGLTQGRYQPPHYIPPESLGRQALNIDNNPLQNYSPGAQKVAQPGTETKGQAFTDDALNPLSATGAHIEYIWKIAGFKECSASCAGGRIVITK